MITTNAIYTDHDYEAIEILKDFLPDKIFDAHAHLHDTAFLPVVHPPKEHERAIGDFKAYKEALLPMLCNPKILRANAISYPDRSMADINGNELKQSDEFLLDELNANPELVGEILVHPSENAENIEKRLVHPNIRGLKCYHLLSGRDDSFSLPIGDYLPESAWQVANKKKLCITLHMVRDRALADPVNLDYICKMSAKYPDATLILAHAARSFAAWTALENVEKIVHLENVMYDFSGICESPAMFQIMKKAGVKKCMWGSDYPVGNMRGKAISIADTFYWIYQPDLDRFSSKTTLKNWLVGIENLMSVRQAAIMADLTRGDIEDLFYNNAANLWK